MVAVVWLEADLVVNDDEVVGGGAVGVEIVAVVGVVGVDVVGIEAVEVLAGVNVDVVLNVVGVEAFVLVLGVVVVKGARMVFVRV